tara:strand:- start:54 stop:419 length:366 start_codon:yes stop_codon:yes gene_type:complete
MEENRLNMSDNKPDKWVVVKLLDKNKTSPLYKVFGTWYGGYTGSDSWKLNSGIRSIEDTETSYIFHGYSGSKYICNKNKSSYGTSSYTGSVLNSIIDSVSDYKHNSIEILSYDNDWLKLKD